MWIRRISNLNPAPVCCSSIRKRQHNIYYLTKISQNARKIKMKNTIMLGWIVSIYIPDMDIDIMTSITANCNERKLNYTKCTFPKLPIYPLNICEQWTVNIPKLCVFVWLWTKSYSKLQTLTTFIVLLFSIQLNDTIIQLNGILSRSSIFVFNIFCKSQFVWELHGQFR